MISYKLLGTREWFVIHHTNCGMEFFTDDVCSHETDGFHDVGTGPGSTGGCIHRLADHRRPENSVTEDVERIRNHPLVPKSIPIYGYVYDVKSGRLVEVPAATAAGKAA